MPDLYFFRDSNGNEVDILYQAGRDLTAIEVKSASTFTQAAMKGLAKFKKNTPQVRRACLIYNGEPMEMSDGTGAIHFKGLHKLFE